jgi:hypothetical protein
MNRPAIAAALGLSSREALPYSMIAADLNKDGKPDIVMGYVHAPGAVYFNDGTGRECIVVIRRQQGRDLSVGRGRPPR